MFMVAWKPDNKYVTTTAGFMKNGVGLLSQSGRQFRARPLKLYRRQYQENPTTRYSLASAGIIDTPASFNVNLVEDNTRCVGITHASDHLLSTNVNQQDVCCYAEKNHNKPLVMSNRQRLYKKLMTYDQNMPKSNVSKFNVGSLECSNTDDPVMIYGYVKNTNRKFRTTSAVSSSSKILRQKEDAIRYTIMDHANKNYDTYCLAKRHKCNKI